MISLKLKPGGKLERMILDACRTRIRQSAQKHSTRAKQWRQGEETFTLYLPEKEEDNIRRNRREEGTPEYTTIKMPYSYAVAMTAHSYFTSVFLARSPVLQFMGNTDEGEMQVLAVEALHNYQMFKGRMLPILYIYLQDPTKYGEAWVLNYWREDRSRVSSIIEEEEKFLGLVGTGRTIKKRVTKEVTSYQGNSLKNLHPSKVFTDPRYSRGRFQEGEFVAIETEVSKNQLIVGAQGGQYMNIDKLITKGTHGETLTENYMEYSTDPNLERPELSDFSSHFDAKALDVYKCYEVYINLVPSLWGLGASKLPEKWVFTVDEYYSAVIEARPMGNMHDKFPLAYLEIEPEGYSMWSRSILEIFTPIQNTVDWLINSHLFNVRQMMNNQVVYDPSRIVSRDLESRTPGKAIRLSPGAYGSDARTALHQLQLQDVTQNHLSDIAFMYDMGERLGINDQVMGITAPSSRRSAQEIRGDQTFGTSRLKTNVEYFSATGFSDLGSMMLANSQQFYDIEQKLRIAGQAAQIAGQQFINVTPESIAGQYMLEPVDGTLPIDRFAMVNLWQNLLSQMAQVPQVMAQYDLGKIFGYVAQLGGIKNLNRFKVELVPDDMLQQQVQQGNVIPMNDGNTLEPGQIAGVGPTA